MEDGDGGRTNPLNPVSFSGNMVVHNTWGLDDTVASVEKKFGTASTDPNDL